MRYLNVVPVVSKVFGYQTPVAMVWGILTAKQTRIRNHVSRYAHFYLTIPHEFEKLALADDDAGVGPRHLLRLFLRHAGASPSEVAATKRVQKAKRLIDETTMPLAEIAFAAGFGSVRRFNDAFLSTYQRTPSSFRGASKTRPQNKH